ncbi:MAG: prolyl oligopeptidase family serine peptidase [Candidatus Eisenbacteria bacterium]|nr:prolyl oligopeptidase family serine peptidase [Candidatus Eisenbacteria bacterium]
MPLSILVYRKGVVRDGSAPTLITASDAYGLSVTPNNQTMMAFPLNLAFLERGRSLGHRPGGWRRGRGLKWHEAGKPKNKHRSWEDLIDCAEYLVSGRWTSPARLAVHGRSAGAIPMGRGVTERPDLFAVGISNVGVHNSLRGSSLGAGQRTRRSSATTRLRRRAAARAPIRAPTCIGLPTAVLLSTGMTDLTGGAFVWWPSLPFTACTCRWPRAPQNARCSCANSRRSVAWNLPASNATGSQPTCSAPSSENDGRFAAGHAALAMTRAPRTRGSVNQPAAGSPSFTGQRHRKPFSCGSYR